MVYLAVTAGPGMELSRIISAIRELPETAGHERGHRRPSTCWSGCGSGTTMHLRDLLLNNIFQIPGVQRTETFLSLADVEPANFTLGLLDQMAERSGRDRAI